MVAPVGGVCMVVPGGACVVAPGVACVVAPRGACMPGGVCGEERCVWPKGGHAHSP